MLRKKMIRDLLEQKGALTASIVIIVIGLMVFTSFSMVMDNLTLSQQNFYQEENFADGFADVKAMPYSQIKHLNDIDGVKQIQGRLIKDVSVLFPNREENVYLRLVSVNPNLANPINGVQLEQGIPLNDNHMNIWIDNKFFETNHLSLNQELDIIAEGKKQTIKIVGTGRNPEFIYAMRNSSDLYPSPETFGIAYIPYNMMKNMFAEGSSVNNLIFTLEPGVKYLDVEQDLKAKLKTYGLRSIYPRKDQTSHLLLTQELVGLQSVAQSLPLLFLSIAAMILYIMLKRMVEQQRGQIGILKAFGYTRKEIMFHYLSYALVIGIVGGVIGALLGIALSYPYTSMYQIYFNMPGLTSAFSIRYFVISIILSILFSLFAGYQGSKKSLSLAPAEAMNPPIPVRGKNTWLEKIPFFWNMLTIQGKMAIRNISRNFARSFFLFLGIMFSFALLVIPWSMNDLTDKMLLDQYKKVETYDVKVSFVTPLNYKETTQELKRFSGVHQVEPIAEIPVTLKNKWYKKDVALLGIKANSKLYNILDKNGRKEEAPKNGVLISERLAELLDAKVGTEIALNSLWFKDNDQDKKVKVVGIIPQYLGMNAYMDIEKAQSLLGQGAIATSLMVNMDKTRISQLQEEYKSSPVINGIEDKKERLRQSEEMMQSFSGMIYALSLFGIVIGFAVIYNSSVITFSERSRELASMRVLGMTSAEVLSVITFEQWFMGFFAIIAGIPAGKLMLVGMASSVNNDIYTMPTTMTSSSLVISFIITIASIWIAQRMAARKIKSLNLVEVLKARD